MNVEDLTMGDEARTPGEEARRVAHDCIANHQAWQMGDYHTKLVEDRIAAALEPYLVALEVAREALIDGIALAGDEYEKCPHCAASVWWCDQAPKKCVGARMRRALARIAALLGQPGRTE